MVCADWVADWVADGKAETEAWELNETQCEVVVSGQMRGTRRVFRRPEQNMGKAVEA